VPHLEVVGARFSRSATVCEAGQASGCLGRPAMTTLPRVGSRPPAQRQKRASEHSGVHCSDSAPQEVFACGPPLRYPFAVMRM
jgi:hypothetical protein